MKIKNAGDFLKVQQAVAMRILALAREKGLAINALANIAGMPPMTIYSILDGKSKTLASQTLSRFVTRSKYR